MSWTTKQGTSILNDHGWLVEKNKRILVKNAHVIDPQQDLDETLDILLEKGKIKKVGNIDLTELEDYNTLDLNGKILVPGFFDMHVHLREPGREDQETILSGTSAAVAGGFTGLACMPNTNPPIDNAGIVQWIQKLAEGGPVTVHPVAAITKGRAGKELSEINELYENGVRILSNDGDSVMDSSVMRHALEYCSMHDMVISTHSEDMNLSEKGAMREGEICTRLGMSPWSSLAESTMVARDVLLAEFTGSRLHIGHISSWQSIEMVRWGKKLGIKVTCEATPHHISLTDESCRSFDSNFKMNPPLGTEKDREAVQQGLIDGTIDCIATDHAPHTWEDKTREFALAPNGVIGLETAIGAVATEMIKTGKMSWNDLVYKMAINPRKIANLPNVSIKEGSITELTIIDPEAVWRVDPDKFLSKSKNTPFTGCDFTGKSLGVLSHGWIMISPDARMLWS